MNCVADLFLGVDKMCGMSIRTLKSLFYVLHPPGVSHNQDCY